MSLPTSDDRRLAVATALRALEQRLERLATALAHLSNPWIQVDGADAPGMAMQRVISAYTTIDLEMDDAPATSVVCLGVVGVPRTVVDLVQEVNAAKAALRAVCAPLQLVRMRVPDGAGTKALPLIRVILRSLQRSDLNLLAAYRRIAVLGPSAPRSVAYTRARTRSVYRKPVEDVARMLENAEGPKAAADRERVLALTGGERHLAQVRDHYENIRANVVYGREDGGRVRMQLAAELPLLYLAKRGTPAPVVTFPALREPDAPVRRRASRLESRPFLETLPVYRYRPEFR
jgi:hypothetical protein